jgi:hypothetical protein
MMGRPYPDDDIGYTAGWSTNTMRSVRSRPRPDFYDPKNLSTDRFGSSHPARFNAVLADGSVRSISYSVDRNLFRNLGDKSDGQPINIDEL